MTGIYKITNKLDGKFYIGQAIDINERWRDHIRDSMLPEDKWIANKRGEQTYFHRALRKYGPNNFVFEVIEECSRDLLNERERYWIDKFNAYKGPDGYNLRPGGEGYHMGTGENSATPKLTNDQVKKIKELLRTRKTIAEIIETLDLPVGATTISDINYGKSWFDPTEMYPISINNGHRTWSDSEAMEIKKRYAQGDTIMDLARELGVRQETISDLVKGKSYTNLPVLERQVDWQRIAKNRKFTEEEVVTYRNAHYQDKKSIKSLHESCGIKITYAAFYNMIKGTTYKNFGGLPK